MFCVSFSSVIRHHLSTEYIDAAHGPTDSHPEFINPVASNCIIVTGNGIVPEGHSRENSLSRTKEHKSGLIYGKWDSYVPDWVILE